MDKTKKMAVILVGLFFVIVSISFYYINSDFDHFLTQSVNGGKSADSLIPLINQEQQKELENAQNHLNSKINDMQNWNKAGVDPAKDEKMNVDFYNQQVDAIGNYSELRKSYVAGNITESEFLQKAQDYKLILD